MYIAFDIETAANDQARAYYAKKEYTPDPGLSTLDDPPSKITDIKSDELRAERLMEWKINQQVKITKSIADRRAADEKKAALHWWTGKVICICIETEEGTVARYSDPDEKTLLKGFFNDLTTKFKYFDLIGKSSVDFDVPFVLGRAMHHDIGIPERLRTAPLLTDVNQIFSYRGSCSQISSLANYAWGLSLESKQGHGSEVADWYKDGLHQKIAEYCAHDTKLVMEILKRWRKPFVGVSVQANDR